MNLPGVARGVSLSHDPLAAPGQAMREFAGAGSSIAGPGPWTKDKCGPERAAGAERNGNDCDTRTGRGPASDGDRGCAGGCGDGSDSGAKRIGTRSR